ncbi:MAG: HGGxSTG domain-containing protein [Beijerinckiaceae bacterium]
MHLSSRCGARSKRAGEPCRAAAMKNGRCRMHGGKSTGAPKGNQNALKHGKDTAAAQAALREQNREIRRILEIERRKFRELPEEWADMLFARLRQR